MTNLAALRVFGRDRPAALPLPAERRVSALAPASVFERYDEIAAGVRALAPGDNVITMFEDIGEDWWTGSGVTAKGVSAQLRAIGERPVEVHINSAGGDMFEGIAIYNILREHPQDITVKIMGMAASAASIIAMAGDKVEIGAASFMMIHNCWVFAMGNRNDMREIADWLEQFDYAARDVYAARSGQKADDVGKWLDEEFWMSGSRAIDLGFADALLPADQITVDEKAKANDKAVNELRGMERALIAAGMTRTAARARIESFRGKRDAAPDDAAKRDADGPTVASMQRLLATMKS
jgi:ATP-dependent protease ClpP protease subunit